MEDQGRYNGDRDIKVNGGRGRNKDVIGGFRKTWSK